MVFNNIEDIKKRLILESEDQTISDALIEEYLEEAEQEVYDNIRRKQEREVFYVTEDQEERFECYFNVLEVKKVYVNNSEYTDYELVDDKFIKIEDLELFSKVEVFYVAEDYKLYERAIVIVNLMTRLNPMIAETTSTVYLNWANKKKTYEKNLKSKYGTGSV